MLCNDTIHEVDYLNVKAQIDYIPKIKSLTYLLHGAESFLRS